MAKEILITASELFDLANRAEHSCNGCHDIGQVVNRLIGIDWNNQNQDFHKAVEEGLSEIIEPYINEYGTKSWKYKDFMLE